MIDISRIEDRFLLENYLLALNFSDGIIPLRVTRRDLLYYQYDPIKEGGWSAAIPASTSTDGITSLGWQTPQRFGSSIIPSKPINVLRVTNEKHVYQLFWGCSPGATRVFTAFPAETNQKNIDIYLWSSAYPAFGYISGFESPFEDPSPRTETFIPPNIDIAYGAANPLLDHSILPLFQFVINQLEVKVIKDVDLIQAILDMRVKCAIKTVGGLENFQYSYTDIYKISPIPLDATKENISKALAGVKI